MHISSAVVWLECSATVLGPRQIFYLNVTIKASGTSWLPTGISQTVHYQLVSNATYDALSYHLADQSYLSPRLRYLLYSLDPFLYQSKHKMLLKQRN